MRAKKDPPGLGLRLKAAERLGEVLKGANFAPFSVAEIADGRDRALANRLVTTALRRHGQLNLVLARSLERGVPKRSGLFEPILRIALAQLLFLPDLGDHSALFLAVEGLKRDTRSAHLAKLANAVLRRAQAEAAEWRLLLPETLFPTALAESWATALQAPRNLKEPVRCSVSSLRKTRPPVRAPSTGLSTSGVRTA